ncbi:RHS repeat-associated core domain-containing protein [Streptomyces chrestomyceticus]|uniref:RHS repeat-associated core domain-containing protein n=1 Tax=Streptomyces chrestomyceticus TaxID=68185 RepID=UPI0019D21558|nr:RHS repeat-associated core domain-containing protein [Streptomyces chrestomyceticus]
MGVVLPGWADELLDLIGVSWPNVDEDDYREMANAMREFADDIDEGSSEAHGAIQNLVSSAGGSVAVEALNAHWGKVNGKHLKNLAGCGRMAGTAMDGVATLIEGAKLGALVQLGILAAEVIAAQAAAPFTFGLSELGALGATQVTRIALKRLFKEACQQVAEQVVSVALTPVEEALAAMVGDLVVQLGANALGVQDGVDLKHAAQAGKEGFQQGVQGAKDTARSAADSPMELLSAGGGSRGGGSGGGSGFSFDEAEHDSVVTGLQNAGGTFRNKAGGKIGRAKGHHSRTRGKDAIADAANGMLEKVIDGIEDAVKKTAKHLDDDMSRGVRQMAKNHRENDQKLSDHFSGLGKGGKPDAKSPNGAPGTSLNSAGKGGNKARDQLGRNHPNNSTRTDGAVEGCGDPVDVATGRVFLRQTDIELPCLPPMRFIRKFESSYRSGRHLGASWASTVDQRLEFDSAGIIFVTEHGLLLSYSIPDEGASVLPVHGPRWPLARTPQGDWSVHEPETGLTRYFSTALHDPDLALLDEVTDGRGNHYHFDYDDRTGAPLAIRHSAGYHVRFTHDEHGKIVALHLVGSGSPDSDVLVKSYGYDLSGNLDTVTDGAGRSTRFEYDEDHRITAWVDSNDSRYEYTYDFLSRCVAQGGAEGHLRYRYDYSERDSRSGRRVTTVTDSVGGVSRYSINDRLQVVARTDPSGATTQSEYDDRDRLLATTDALGRVTRTEYDGDDRPTALIRADGHRTSATYDDRGRLRTLTEPDGAMWQHVYDEQGNRIALIDPSGGVTRYSYDQRGHISSVTDPAGQTMKLVTNAAGLPLTVTDPVGAVTHYAYDSFGRLTTVTNPLNHVMRMVWTTEGHLASRTDANGETERWDYDGEGNCTCYTDQLGRRTRFEYTHFDLATACTTPEGVRYEFAHDTELRLTQVTNPQGLTWKYAYDAVGRLISETDFEGRTLTYAYDATGRLASRTNAIGQTTAYRYDSVGGLSAKDVDGLEITYERDPCGRLLRAVGPDATLEQRHDVLGQCTAETVNGRTLFVSRDSVGRRIGRTTPTGAVTTLTYDAAGHVGGLTISGRFLSFQHDAVGKETRREVGGNVTLAHAWDPAGRLVSQTLELAHSSATLQRRAYSYRGDGCMTSVDDQQTGLRSFVLGADGRVQGVSAAGWSESYAFDETGNQTYASWPDRHPQAESRGERAYSGTRVTRAGNIRYEHDAQGRVVLRQKVRLSRRPDTWHYTWDAEDRLTSVRTPDGSCWRYLYDPLGRRIAKLRSAPGSEDVVEETRFTWDGLTLAEQTTTHARTPVAITITWDHDGLTPLAQTETKCLSSAPQEVIDQRFFAIVTDQVGTPTELIDENGSIAWRSRATVWGVTSWNKNATAYTPLRFPGQYFDAETQLHYNHFRHYDPETARYLSLDPLGLDPAPNPSTYVDNPHLLSDPLGLTPCDEQDVTWGGRVQYGPLGPGNRATWMRATIDDTMLGGRTKARPKDGCAGYVPGKNYNRTHLLGALIGGSNKDSRNFVTAHRNMNSPVMLAIETQIRDAAAAGEKIEYSVTPIYRTNDPSDVIPVGLTIEARGDRGFTFRPYEGGGRSNHISLLNEPKR